MQDWLAVLRRHRVVRASATAIFLYGFAGAATSPYQAVIGIRELGLTDRAYAAIVLAASVANVVLSVATGVLADRLHSYRLPLIILSSCGVLGYGMVWALPSAPVFVLAMIGPLALFHATNPMLFGNLKVQVRGLDLGETAIVNALMRMMISLSWVLVPGLVAFALRGQDSLMQAWAISALAAAGCLALIATGVTPRGTAAPPALPRRPVLADLAELMRPRVLIPVMGVALISQVLHVNATVLPLILTGQAQGNAADIGLTVGMVAALEVGFMFLWVAAARRLPLTRALLLAAGVYLGYLVGLAFATQPWQVYLVSIAAGFAAAGIISLPITYLLELLRDQPGLSASLIAVNIFLGGALGALIFALGSGWGGYPLAAVLSGLAGLGGALLLVMHERRDDAPDHAGSLR